MNIEKEIKEIMAKILEVQEIEIKEDTAIGDLANWDSINHLKIIATIEEKFHIQFTPDVLMDIEDFSDMVRATKERIG